MQAKSRSLLTLYLPVVLALVVGASASATVSHDINGASPGHYAGPQILYSLIQETTQAPSAGFPPIADPEPLWGAPTGSGNNLVFSPTLFSASAGGPIGPGADETHSLLNLAFESINPLLDAIEIINLTEAGDYTLNTFPPGGAGVAASIFLQMTGVLKILEVSDGTSTFAVDETFQIAGVFDVGTPIGIGDTFFTIATNPGGGTWGATYSLDVDAALAAKGGYAGKYATKATIALNNKLQAFGTPGETAAVQKKVGGPALIVEVIPEPATGALLVIGLIALGMQSRHRRV
jgi:hypothetical protein